MRQRFTCRVARAALESLEHRRLLSAGDLDPTFSADGKQIIDLAGSGNEIANAVAIDGSGRVVLAGRMIVGSETDFAVVRLTATGAIDTTFGGGDGVVSVDFAVNDEAMDVAIDSAGRIVVAGISNAGAGSNARDFAVARLTSAGVLDTNFSTDGKLEIDFGANDDAQAVRIHGNTIFVGGYKDLGAEGSFALAKLTNSGALDATYSGDGKVNFAFTAGDDSRCYDIAVQPDGRVVMVGYSENLGAAGATRDLAVARLGTDAVLDPDFSQNGLLQVGIGLDDELRAVGIDFLGRIVAGGFSDPASGGEDLAAIRVTPQGTLDTSFSGDGRFNLNLGNVDKVEDLALAPDGTITLAGSTLGSGFQAAVVQLASSGGAISTSFGDGGDGIQLVDFGTLDQGFAVAIDARFRPVIAGTDGSGHIAVGCLNDLIDRGFATPAAAAGAAYEDLVPLPDGKMLANGGFLVRRLLPTGAVDPTFTPITNDTAPEDIAVDHAGRVIVANTIASFPGSGGAAAVQLRRFRSDGSVDTAFGGGDGATELTYAAGRDSTVEAIAIDSNNRIVIGGNLQRGDTEDPVVARVTAGGSLDASFHDDGINVFVLSPVTGSHLRNLAIQPSDGRIVAVGNDDFDGFVLRLDTDGTRDGTFAGNGNKQIAFGIDSFTEVLDVAFDSSGRLVIGGYKTGLLPADQDFGFVARLTSGGDFDSGFNNGNAKLAFQMAPDGEEVIGLTLDATGKIVALCRVDYGDNDFRVAVRRVLANGTGMDATFSGDGVWTSPQAPDVSPLRPVAAVLANGAIHVGGGQRVVRLNVDPAVVDFEFLFETAPQRLRVQFNDDVGASLADNDLAIRNATTNLLLPATAYDVVSYDAITNAAIVQFNAVLADGDYTVTFGSTGIENAQGMNLGGDRVRDFFFLQGDANRDRRVNLADFNILAANFGRAPRTFGQGDFSYDGTVNLIDFNLLASRFGAALAPGAPADATSDATADATADATSGDEREHLADLLADDVELPDDVR